MTAPTVILDIDLSPQPSGVFAYYAPNETVLDPTDGVTLSTAPQVVAFNGSLQSPVLYATDNANMSPSGWSYGLSFSQNPLVPGNPAPLTNFQVPVGPLTYTATHATPCVVTPAYTAAFTTAFPNGLPNGTGVEFTSGTPAGFTVNTTYYIVNAASATFQLAATRGGSAIASTGTGGGNLQVTRYAYSGLAAQTPVATVTPYLTAAGNLAGVNQAAAQANLGIPGALGGSAVTQALKPSFLSAGTVYAAVVNDLAVANCTTGNTTVNLPSAPANASIISVKLGQQNTPSGSTGFYTVTVNARGSDVFELAGGKTSETIALLNEAVTWQYNASAGVWVRQWGALRWVDIQNSMPKVYNVVAFGADPTGTADSTAAIQGAINQATGSAAPASNTRTPVAGVYLPSGSYKVSSDISIRSVSGFRFFGDGPGNTLLYATGTSFTQAVLFIDGSLDGVFHGFAIQGDGTEQVPDGIRLDWTTAAARSTSGNCFRDIRVRNLKFVTGISLEGNGARQLDGTTFENVVVTGSQVQGSWSGSGNWQAGFAFGNGTFGNNYDHRGVGVDAAQCYYGYKVYASSMSINGAQPAANFSDFWVVPNGQCTFTNIQSQNGNQFLTTTSSFAPAPVSFADVQITTNYLNSGGILANIYGGMWSFKNVAAVDLQKPGGGTYVIGIFSLIGASATRPGIVSFDNIALYGARASSILPSGSGNPLMVNVQNYANYNPNTGVYTAVTGDVLSCYTGGAWTNIV